VQPQILHGTVSWIQERQLQWCHLEPPHILAGVWRGQPQIQCFQECYSRWTRNRCVLHDHHDRWECCHYVDLWLEGGMSQWSSLWNCECDARQKRKAPHLPMILQNSFVPSRIWQTMGLHMSMGEIVRVKWWQGGLEQQTEMKWSSNVTCPSLPLANLLAYSAFLIECIDTASVIVSTSPEVGPVIRIRKLGETIRVHSDNRETKGHTISPNMGTALLPKSLEIHG